MLETKSKKKRQNHLGLFNSELFPLVERVSSGKEIVVDLDSPGLTDADFNAQGNLKAAEAFRLTFYRFRTALKAEKPDLAIEAYLIIVRVAGTKVIFSSRDKEKDAVALRKALGTVEKALPAKESILDILEGS